MAIIIKPKRSEVAGAPTAGDLAVGELALNFADTTIYSKKSDGTIVSFVTSTTTPAFFSEEVDLGDLAAATNTYDMSSLDGGSPASGGGITLTDLSVGAEASASGDGAISYNNTTGVFTYTPPDLSSYLTDYTVTQSDVTAHEAALIITESQISDLQTYLTSETFTSLVQDTTPQLGGNLDGQAFNITTIGTITAGTMTDGTVSFSAGNVTGVDTLRINETGTGLRMTNVGAFDNDGSTNFRIFSNNDLILSTNGDSGTALTLDATSKDATFTGGLTVSSAYTQGTADYYTKQYVLQGTTTNATETEILIGGSTRIPVPTDTTLFYEVSIVSRRTDATGESGAWHLKGCVDNFSDTVADVGNVYEIAVAQDDVGLAVDIRADNTNDAINVFVTGAASKTIRWTAIVKTTEVAE